MTTTLSRRGANPHSCRFQCVFLVRWEHHIAYSGEELRFRQPGKCPAVLLDFGEIFPPHLLEGCEGLPRPQRRPFPSGPASTSGHKGVTAAAGLPWEPRPKPGYFFFYLSRRGISQSSPCRRPPWNPPPRLTLYLVSIGLSVPSDTRC